MFLPIHIKYFNINFKKSIDKIKFLLYHYTNLIKGGDNIQGLIHYFFISFIIHIFVVFYTIYSFFNLKVFHNLQGYKLNIKKNTIK